MILFTVLIMYVWLREFDEASQKHGREAADGRSETGSSKMVSCQFKFCSYHADV